MVLYKEITKERYVCERASQNNEQNLNRHIMVANNGTTSTASNLHTNGHNGQMITLNIRTPHSNHVQSMQFDVQMFIGQVSRAIHEHLSLPINQDPMDYGLFVHDVQQPTRSYWLDASRTLSYYSLKNGDQLEYRSKYRPLKIRLLDGTIKTLLVDESLIIAQLMVYICTALGIANYDEYSLIYDLDADDGHSSKSATLRRDRSLQRTDKKMEELKKKCHTDDDTLWLDSSKTLRQQEIDEQSTVVLRRKYFFSDTNIDQRDPVQLNLLYIQCRNGILDGTHPVSYDEAVQFAGLQSQIQFGDQQESKYKSHLLDVREFLPKEYAKTKGVEKRIFQEHKKFQGIGELDGKLKYIQLCRSLRTYGVTFFLVKEKMASKNKLVPRLLGVTKDSILRVDERSKEFLEVWPLTHVKRWTASPNTFTLDFGDYATAYYSVQTNEGQQISQLIAGYIDIILKTRKDREMAMRDGIHDEEATMIEDMIAPGKATIIQPHRVPFNYVHPQNVFPPPPPAMMHGPYLEDGPYPPYAGEYYSLPPYPVYPVDPHFDHDPEEYFISQIHEQPKLSSILHGGTVLYSSIENARNMMNNAQSQLVHDLQMEYNQPPSSSILMDTQTEYSIENRLDVSRQLLTSELSAINAATAQIVTLTSDVYYQAGQRRNSEYNHSLGAAISTITNNLNEFCKEMEIYTSLFNEKNNLMDQTNRLCTIFNDLLTHIEALSDNHTDSSSRQNILVTASRLGEVSQDLVRRLTNELTNNPFDSSTEYQEKLLSLAKSVANTTASYVLKAKDIVTNVSNQEEVNDIISTATQCALATSQLVACTKVVASTISSPLCQEQLIESARSVTRSIEAVLRSCAPPIATEQLYHELTEAGGIVRKNLNDFLLHIKLVTDSTAASFESFNGSKHLTNDKQTTTTTTTTRISRRTIANDEIEEEMEEDEDEQDEIVTNEKRYDQSIDQILVASDRLFSSVGDASEMVKQAKVLAQATAQLVSLLRQQAEAASDDTNEQKKLLSAAKMLADATAKMVESAKACASQPNDTQLQYQLKKAAEELRSATNVATSNSIKRKILKRVEQCAKHCASCATQCIAATSGSAPSNKNHQSHHQLVEQCKIVADLIPKMVQGIRGCMVKPDSFSSQANLLNACEDFLEPAARLAQLAKASVPTVHDQSQALHLNNSSKQLTQALNDLRSCLTRAQELCGSMPLDIESIVESIEMLDRELDEIKRQAKDGHLKAKPDETIDTSSTQLCSVCKQVNTIISQLLSAVSQSDEKTVESCTREILQILRRLTNSTRGIAATSNDHEVQESIIERSHHVLKRSTNLVREAKKAIHTPNDLEIQTKLAECAREVSFALNACLATMPSQRYLDEAIKQMSEYIYALAGPFDKNTRSQSTQHYEEKQAEITRSAANLNQATTDFVVSTRAGTTQDLGKTSTRFTRAFGDFLDNGIDLIHHQPEEEKRTQLIISLKNVHSSSNQLLERAKTITIEPTSTNESKQELANAARSVTEHINRVLNVCITSKVTTDTSVGQVECDNARREMETAKTYLQQPVLQAYNSWTYYEALDQVVENSKRLGEAMTHIASASKNSNHQLFTQAVQDASKAVSGLAESSAQASYLIGVSEVTSTKGTSAIVDQSLFTRSVTAIRHACSDLANPNIDQREVLTLATSIARNTSILCNASREASSNTSNPIARRRFVQSAKDVANATAELVRTIKVLDTSFTQENHRHCIEMSRPLLQATDELYTYAMSKEFASIPASISSHGRQLQEPVLSAARNVVDGACRIVDCSKNLIINAKEPAQWQQLATHTKSVSESIKRLATSVKDLAPGQRESERAINELRSLYQEVDTAITNVDSLRKTDKSLQFHQEQISSSSHFLTELVFDIRQSSKRESERIGSSVTQFVTYIEPFIRHTIDYVSCMTHRREKSLILDQVKSIVETSLQLLIATKESGGNMKHTQWHHVVDDNSELLTRSIHRLVHTLEDQSSSIGIMSGLSENIRKLISTLDTTLLSNEGHFVEYQTRMVEILRQMARTTQEILTQTDQTENSRHLANQLTREYNELINATYGAIGTATTNELATRIKSVVSDLGYTCIELIEKLGLYHSNHHDQNLKHTIETRCHKVIEKISYILAALQAGARGTQACINAASTVSGIIADLDTTILFATAGTLNSEHDGETFADHREAILKTAKALVEDTKTLVAGAASSQEQLASAAQAAVRTITKLAEVVKLGAASLGADDGEAQVMLINSVKDVALALNNLINVTKSASGKSIDDPEMQKLKESAKVMVTNVTSLLRTVKSVEDEAQRGTNALEATIESIAQELRLFNNGQAPLAKSTAEDLIRATKQITLATTKAVAAGQSCRQEDIIAAANLGRKSASDFLFICKSSAFTNDDKALQQKTLESGRLCMKYYKELLETVHILIQKPSNETKQKLLNYSRLIAQSTQELVQCAKQLKGADLVDPDDPTYIAENELFNAAQSIELAAKKLSSLKPRRKPKEVNENLNFDEQILEAAKSIMNAAGALINAATSAQKELASQRKKRTNPFLPKNVFAAPTIPKGTSPTQLGNKTNSEDDGQWSQGLISAARYVASACHVLCDAANGLVQGYGTEEKLISSAKQVSSNTAALLVACKVKADFMSQSMARLQTAGNAVKRAADALVRSAQHAVEMQQEDKYFEVSLRVVPGIAQEIKCKEAILTKERELDEARNRLKAIRLAKYGHNEQDSNEST